MSIKEIFNQKPNHELLLAKINALEKKQSRLDALKVHVDRVLKLEDAVTQLIKSHDSKNESREKVKHKEGKKYTHRGDLFLEEMSTLVESFLAKIKIMDQQIGQLEKNITRLLQSHSDIQVKMESIEERLAVLENGKKEKDSEQEECPVVIKEIHIDKFYLDKYEQNNNFAQLGIKNLSGALNIGATYGREVLPKDISDQVKKDLEEMKNMYKQTTGEEESSALHESSDDTEEHFTEIPLDDSEESS